MMAVKSAPVTPSASVFPSFLSSTESDGIDSSLRIVDDESCDVENHPEKHLEAKVVMLGSQGVGKTSVLIRYMGHSFSNAISPTIGASFFTTKLCINNYKVKLQVWDTAGQERFRAMALMYYRKANAAILVFDVTKHSTFEDMKSWIDELQRNSENLFVICILGNKTDLQPLREVSARTAGNYANQIGALLIETSALADVGVQEAFDSVARELINFAETSPRGSVLFQDRRMCASCENTLDDSHIQRKYGLDENNTPRISCPGCT